MIRPVPLVFVLFATALAAQGPVFVQVDPKATYLLRSFDPGPDAPPIDLSTVGATPGSVLRIRQIGDWDNGPGGDSFRATGGAFSNGTTMLPPSNLARLPGAVAAGCPRVSPPAYRGNVPTDIPEDFRIAEHRGPFETAVEVPAGATHLFVTAMDSMFGDNSDPDGDYGVELQVVPPGTWTDLGNGLAGSSGVPVLAGTGTLAACEPFTLDLSSARPNSLTGLVLGFSRVDLPVFGGTLVPAPNVLLTLGSTDGSGNLSATFPVTLHFPSGYSFYVQEWVLDPSNPMFAAASNGLQATFP